MGGPLPHRHDLLLRGRPPPALDFGRPEQQGQLQIGPSHGQGHGARLLPILIAAASAPRAPRRGHPVFQRVPSPSLCPRTPRPAITPNTLCSLRPLTRPGPPPPGRSEALFAAHRGARRTTLAHRPGGELVPAPRPIGPSTSQACAPAAERFHCHSSVCVHDSYG